MRSASVWMLDAGRWTLDVGRWIHDTYLSSRRGTPTYLLDTYLSSGHLPICWTPTYLLDTYLSAGHLLIFWTWDAGHRALGALATLSHERIAYPHEGLLCSALRLALLRLFVAIYLLGIENLDSEIKIPQPLKSSHPTPLPFGTMPSNQKL